jgi:hypothetical protein
VKIIKKISNTPTVVKRKITRRQPGAPKMANYFDESTQDAIVEYQACLDSDGRKKIYVEKIMPAFSSLVENLINVYGFNVLHESKSDIKNECMEFLYMTVEKFDASKGSKAFSYFNVVAKNWLTIKSKQNVKRTQSYISIDNYADLSKEDQFLIETYHFIPAYDEIISPEQHRKDLKKIIETVASKAKSANEKICVNAIEILLQNIDDIDLLSKRAVLTYIKEISGLSSKQLSLVLSSLKKHYREFKKYKENEI